MNKTIVALQKKLVAAPNDGQDNRKAVATVQANLMGYAYMLSQDAFLALAKADMSFIEQWHNEAITYLKKMTGEGNYRAFHKNFPQDVLSKSNSELLWEMCLNYWTYNRWEPAPPALAREVSFENVTYNMLEAATEERFQKIFTDLVSINTSLTGADMEVIEWFVKSGQPLAMPASIPFKENLCTLAAMGLAVPVKTPTDVLRIAVHMSGGDITLPKVPRAKVNTKVGTGYRFKIEKVDNVERKKFRFKKFTRKERKILLALLEQTHCRTDEMVLKANRWVRLGEILHPGEYKNQYPKAYEAIRAIRGGEKGKKTKKPTSWYGRVDAAFKTSFITGINKLKERPGEFMRKLDLLVRQASQPVAKRRNAGGQPPIESAEEKMLAVFGALSEVGKGSSNKVLFETYQHFQKRLSPTSGRSIFIKGAKKRTPLPDLPALPAATVEEISQVIFATLREKFKELPPLGNCWIDEKLKDIPLPANMRSTSLSLKPTMRGQHIPFNDQTTKTIRPFLHFKKPDTHGTIDLSVVLIGDRKNAIVAWNHQREGDICVHSGDSMGRTGACAEYVDINIELALKAGYKYALVQMHNWNRQKALNDNNHFGIMERSFPKSNALWMPETISNCHIVTVKDRVNYAIIDLENRSYIIVDEEGDANAINMASVSDFKKVSNYVEKPKVSVYDLLLMHVETRGRLVLLENAPETLFKVEDFVNSYEEVAKYMI
jgi:hypothetical protein